MAPTMFPSLEINSWAEESLPNLATNILNIASKPLVLIDGIAGSGKTTLSVKIADILNCVVIPD